MAAHLRKWAKNGVFGQKIRPILSSDWSYLEEPHNSDTSLKSVQWCNTET